MSGPTLETRFNGLPISPGIAMARVCLFSDVRHGDMPRYCISTDELAEEKRRVEQGVRVAAEQLDRVIAEIAHRIGPAEAQIFEVHKAILTDPSLTGEIFNRIEIAHVNAETAVLQTLGTYQSRFSELGNEYLRDRVSDIGEVQRWLLGALSDRTPQLQCSEQAHCRRGRGRIIAAEELTPRLTVGPHTEKTRGFVTERGGATSHAAILARSLGIPAVSGLADIYRILDCGTELLLNGDTGAVVVWPSPETVAQFGLDRPARPDTPAVVPPVPQLTVLANISHSGETALAVHHRAEGIGLYRTEMEFLAEDRILSEEEQYYRYAAVVQEMHGKPVCFRLLDLGGDKRAPFLALPPEVNPSLGLRGSRLLLARRDLLRPQARALARASLHGPVNVLYPMIVDVAQFLQLRTAFRETIADLPTGAMRHGVMFEVPSACLQARQLLQEAHFGSIGTNDLIQFLFAVDRNDSLANNDISFDQPALWSLLSHIAVAARETERPISVCGEVASHVPCLPALMKIGLTTLSVAPRLIPQARLAANRQTL